MTPQLFDFDPKANVPEGHESWSSGNSALHLECECVCVCACTDQCLLCEPDWWDSHPLHGLSWELECLISRERCHSKIGVLVSLKALCALLICWPKDGGEKTQMLLEISPSSCSFPILPLVPGRAVLSHFSQLCLRFQKPAEGMIHPRSFLPPSLILCSCTFEPCCFFLHWRGRGLADTPS